MTKQELQERITKKEEQIKRIEKAIKKYIDAIKPSPELLKACEEHNIVNYKLHKEEFNHDSEHYYSSDDLWRKYYDLIEAKAIVNKYREQIDVLDNFEKETKIQVLVDFLEDWKLKSYSWYVENIKQYLELKSKFSKSWEEKEAEYKTKYRANAHYYFNKEYYENINSLTKDLCWGINKFENVDLNKLTNILNEEAKRKYKDLVNRITAVVGVIEDVSGLSIGSQNGEINGTVIGNKGKVNIETISAGGPVQCWHYRVILHKVK